jgi:diadenosine tetraphosphate (Ap4A) HIT family hydrolase
LSDCFLCNTQDDRAFLGNDLAYCLWDAFPVTRLHTLIVPRRHAQDYFSLTSDEVLACNDLLHKASDFLRSDDQSVEGFNIGVNVGSVAGQTVFHCHVHLIPRRRGDVEDPRGGVRHLIPGKGAY